jgi:recombinational DNA repair ATPase RecF
VYARCPLLVLDDVFSALDEKTSWSILCRLLGPNGMLRERGVTVVAATNSSEYETVVRLGDAHTDNLLQ